MRSTRYVLVSTVPSSVNIRLYNANIIDLKRKLDLPEEPYQVHRLDKVSCQHNTGTVRLTD